jgi:hypothetical protein
VTRDGALLSSPPRRIVGADDPWESALVNPVPDMPPPAMPPEVAAAFERFPPAVRARLLAVRRLILETAAGTSGVGPLTEALRWGEPAYLTASSRSGSTIRLGWKAAAPERCAVYFDCKTSLVETFRVLAADEFSFEGNRAILLDASAEPSTVLLTACLAQALTYHLRKRRRVA